MGVFLIGIIFGLTGVALLYMKKKHLKSVRKLNRIAIIMCCLSLVILITAGITTLFVQSLKEVNYYNARYEKSVLEYRQEADGGADNDLLYREIVEFNKNLRETKFWANNFWTNCFNNDMIASLDYIELQAPVIERHPEFAVNN